MPKLLYILRTAPCHDSPFLEHFDNILIMCSILNTDMPDSQWMQASLIPWSRGRPLAWDITTPDILATLHIAGTSVRAAAAKAFGFLGVQGPSVVKKSSDTINRLP